MVYVIVRLKLGLDDLERMFYNGGRGDCPIGSFQIDVAASNHIVSKKENETCKKLPIIPVIRFLG